jgi:predicted GNAT family N-acyltransferase
MSNSKPNNSFRIARVGWREAGSALSTIRRSVFIEEQGVPEALEWDGLDEAAIHFLATDAGQRPIGCARLLEGGRVGRMAVLKSWRQQGVGRALLEAAMAECRRQGLAEMTLSAQTHAIRFYEGAGFAVCSDIYDDAGIPHRDMAQALSS